MAKKFFRRWLGVPVILSALCMSTCGGGGSYIQPHPPSVSISPLTARLLVTETAQFNARISGIGDPAVNWSVNGVVGGNSAFGTISSAGLYTAPAIPPSPNTVTVEAASVATPVATDSVQVVVTNPTPILGAVSPPSTDAGGDNLSLVLTGSGFAAQSKVMLGSTALATGLDSRTQLSAVVPAALLENAGVLPVTVQTPSPGGGASSALDFAVRVAVGITPTAPTLNILQTQQFSASVTGSSNQAVAWSVSDVPGGNETLGTITATGLYGAPAIPPSPNQVTVKAVSAVDPGRAATAAVTVTYPVPVLSTISPASADAGSAGLPLAVTGAGLTPQSTVLLGGSPLATSFVSRTQLTATVPAEQLGAAGSFPVTVQTPGPGGGTSNAASLKVMVVVGVAPPAQTVNVGQNLQFSATVTGSSNQNVTWSVNGTPGGSSTAGTITPAGLYAAPMIPPSPNQVAITAASLVDSARRASAVLTLVNPVPVLANLSPAQAQLGGTATLTLTGAGFTPQSVARFGDYSLSTGYVSPTQLTATVPPSLLAATGAFNVTVVNPSPGGGTSNPAGFTVNQAPAITSGSSATFTVGAAGSFTLTATGYPPPAWSETGVLPSGVTFNPSTGVLAGVPAAGTGGTFSIIFKASNGVGTDAVQNFVLAVNQPPAVTSAASATFTVGAAGSFTLTATGYPPPAWSETGVLPSGVTFNSSTGVLTGIPAAGTGRTYNIAIKASNGAGTDAIQNFVLTVNQAAIVTSPASATFTVGALSSFSVTATGYPAPALSQTGALPAGLAFNAGSGVLAGTAATGTGGKYNLTFKAMNGVGEPALQNFVLSVNQAPEFTSAANTAFTAGAAGSFTVTTTGYPKPVLSRTGSLPGGMTFDASTGVLSGTPTTGSGGAYTLTIKASNGVGTDASQNFLLTVNEAPAFTSAAGATFTVGAANSFTVVAAGYPAPTLSQSGALPGGVSFNASTGRLSGTPAAGTGGTYNLAFQAANGVGTDAGQNFTLGVNQAPAITSSASATFTVLAAGSFSVTSTGYPAPTLSQTGTLPSGVTFNASTGTLSGIPAAGSGRTYNLTFRASNGAGTDASQSFVLNVNQAPAFISAALATFAVGAPGSFVVTATGYPAPALRQAGALPSGVSFNANTGILSGTPGTETGGIYTLTFSAANGVGTDATQDFTLAVNQAPAITSGDATTFIVGEAGSFTVTATGYPAPTLSQSGALPGGVSFNASTATLSGAPASGTGGNYSLIFKAANGVGTDATLNFTLTVNQAPSITSAASATFTVGSTGSFTLTATGNPTPTLSETGAMPGGVTFDPLTGALAGTPGSNAGGTYGMTFRAANGISPDATQTFTLTVENPAPVLYSVSPPGATAGGGTMTLTLTGSSFTRQSVVYADATLLGTSYVNSTQLRATLPSAIFASTGTLALTVVSTSPGGGTSTSLAFRIWPGYPRSDATSVILGPPPPLVQLPQTGTLVTVLDWTGKDNQGTPEDVLAAGHMLTEMGIPSLDTTSLSGATANRFLVVAGVLNTASSLSSAEVNALVNYAQSGGTLYLWQPGVNSLLSALGLGSAINHSGTETRPLTFDVSRPDPLLAYVDAQEEVHWQPTFASDDITRGYAAGSCTPLAAWNTGDYAALRCDLGSGRAYIFGWRLRSLLAFPERQLLTPDVEWTNVPILDADICRMLMRGSYEGLAANPQVRQWAPEGHPAALIITHDVDATVSYRNVPAWVDFEESLGVKSTFLFTTNPYDTGYISPMFTPAGRTDIQYAINHGFEAANHSFGHFPDFYVAPYTVGPHSEDASNYLPMFTSNPPGSLDCCTSGMSVLGEAGVSKWLMETDLGVSVPGFRSGYLHNPPDLIRGLAAIGYRRDSTYALAQTRGSFPFVPFDVDQTVTPHAVITYRLLEYPVTISEDQEPALDSTTLDSYLSAWKKLIRINYGNNVPTVLLIHPIDTGIRFQILQQLLSDLEAEGLDVWVGDWKTFAEFWEAQGATTARWP